MFKRWLRQKKCIYTLLTDDVTRFDFFKKRFGAQLTLSAKRWHELLSCHCGMCKLMHGHRIAGTACIRAHTETVSRDASQQEIDSRLHMANSPSCDFHPQKIAGIRNNQAANHHALKHTPRIQQLRTFPARGLLAARFPTA
jgi:hypothetical protein